MDAGAAKISVVVPLYNEGKAIASFLDQLEPLRDACEVVFSDGGSSDGTCRAIPPWAKLVHSAKGRGVQLNVGAAAATGDILVFLHCDSALPEGFLHQVRQVLRHHDMGFFGIRFDDGGWLMSICARQSNRRARRGVPFGDQGIFIWRNQFDRLGGFPDLPIMEDYQFSLNARAAGLSMGQTRSPLITSSRRFGTGTVHKLRVMAQMHMLRWRYRHGTSPQDLERAYRDVR